MPLFETLEIDTAELERQVRLHWGVSLGRLVKASQNHTFEGTQALEGEEDQMCIVRVTPDPDTASTSPVLSRVLSEAEYVWYLAEHGLPVCPPLPRHSLDAQASSFLYSTQPHYGVVQEGGMVICVSQYAEGVPVIYPEFKWRTEKMMVKAQGEFLGRLHLLSRQFASDRPDAYRSFRRYDELHDGVLKGVALHEEDRYAIESDASTVGLLHGDLNPSNFFWIPERQVLSVFDWDQAMIGWFAYDLSQPVFAVSKLHEQGNPITMTRSDVTAEDVEWFTDRIVEGYESVTGVELDRVHLARMVELRKLFYHRFCTRALKELEENPRPELDSMKRFMEFCIHGPKEDATVG